MASLTRWVPGIRAAVATGFIVWAAALAVGTIVYATAFTVLGGNSAEGWDSLGTAINSLLIAVPAGAIVGVAAGVRWCRGRTTNSSVVLCRVLGGPLIVGLGALLVAWAWDSLSTFPVR